MTENPSLVADGQEEVVDRDGVLMPLAQAKAAAEAQFRAGQEAAAFGTPLASFSDMDPATDAYGDFKAGYDSPFKQEDWEVELAGNGQDLYGMTMHGGSPDYFRIWGGTDHVNDCTNNDFSFNSLYFNGQRDPEVIWQQAYELVRIFNGASELFTFRARKQTIRGIYFRESQLPTREQARVISLLGRPSMHPHRWEQHLSNAMQMSPRLGLLVLATEKEDIYMMLRYLELESSWSNYYKLLETMETHAQLMGKTIPGTRADRGRFTNNANNFSLLGYDARHGLRPLSDNANTEAVMSLEEAHVFITGRCKGYLNTVYPEYFNLQ